MTIQYYRDNFHFFKGGGGEVDKENKSKLPTVQSRQNIRSIYTGFIIFNSCF